MFSTPGGKVDSSDYSDYTDYYKRYTSPKPTLTVLRKTASRELKEETGIFVSTNDFQPVYESEHSWRDEIYYCTTFFAITDQEPRPVEPGTWVGWRKPCDLVDPKLSPFADFNIEMFKYLGIRDVGVDT